MTFRRHGVSSAKKKGGIGEASRGKCEEKYGERAYQNLSVSSVTRQLSGYMPRRTCAWEWGENSPPFPRSLDYEVTVSQLVNFDQRKALEHGPCGLVSGKMYVFIRARRSVGSGKPGDSGHARKIRFGHALANVATFKTGSVLHVLKNSVSLHDLFLSALSVTRQLVGCMPRRFRCTRYRYPISLSLKTLCAYFDLLSNVFLKCFFNIFFKSFPNYL